MYHSEQIIELAAVSRNSATKMKKGSTMRRKTELDDSYEAYELSHHPRTSKVNTTPWKQNWSHKEPRYVTINSPSTSKWRFSFKNLRPPITLSRRKLISGEDRLMNKTAEKILEFIEPYIIYCEALKEKRNLENERSHDCSENKEQEITPLEHNRNLIQNTQISQECFTLPRKAGQFSYSSDPIQLEYDADPS